MVRARSSTPPSGRSSRPGQEEELYLNGLSGEELGPGATNSLDSQGSTQASSGSPTSGNCPRQKH